MVYMSVALQYTVKFIESLIQGNNQK